MADDSDGDAYDEIGMDRTGKPIIPTAKKRPPIPLPKGSATPPTARFGPLPTARKTDPLAKGPTAPSLPPLNKRWTQNSLTTQVPGSASTLPPPGSRKFRSKTMSESSAPPLPPKPPPSIPSASFDDLVITGKKRKGPAISDYILDSEELAPSQFVKKYQDEFPLKVRVCKGFYGHSERTSVSEGDSFNIHFVKHTKVVHMLDGGGATYKIALNSALEFGLMYDPNQKREEALNGFTFEKVSDILVMKVLPKAIRAGAGWRGSSASSSVEHNELLVVKGIKRRLNSKSLKVFNPATKKKKDLPESCAGKFSTRPYDVRFFLPEIIEHIPEPVPCMTMLFVHAETASELPAHLVTSVVNLTCTSIETSLIATNTDVDDFTDAPMMDIPLDLDIEFQVLHYKRPEDTEQLYTDTRTLLEHFNPSKVSSYANPNSSNDYSTQSAFTSLVREENPLSGVDIVKPPTIYYNLHEVFNSQSTLSSSVSSNQPSPTKSGDDPIYELEPNDSVFSTDSPLLSNRMAGSTQEYEQRLKQVEESLKDFTNFQATSTQISRSIISARADMKRLEGRTIKASEDVSGLRTELTELSATMVNLQGTVSALQSQMKMILEQGTSGSSQNMAVSPVIKDGGYYVIPPTSERAVSHDGSLSAVSSPMTRSTEAIPENICEQNRLYLASLDYMQVLTLLELMGLKSYQEAFMTERINGEMLLECDDEVLQEELKVTSKLRRVRLLKLISGRHSAEQILKGEDPYVYASPK